MAVAEHLDAWRAPGSEDEKVERPVSRWTQDVYISDEPIPSDLA